MRRIETDLKVGDRVRTPNLREWRITGISWKKTRDNPGEEEYEAPFMTLEGVESKEVHGPAFHALLERV